MTIFSSRAFAQTVDPVQQAFSTSSISVIKGDYAKAIEIIKKAYKEDSYELNLQLGWLSYSIGQFKESVLYYQKAIDLKPKAIEARLGYVKPAAELVMWDAVAKQYTEILNIDPNQTTANYYLGLIYYNKADYANAQKYFEKVVNLYPSDNDSLIMLGWTILKLTKSADIQQFLNHDNAYQTNLRLGWLNYSMGQYEDSMSYYQKAIGMKPKAIEPRLGYVKPAAAFGMWDAVAKQYTEILNIDPNQTFANYQLGFVYYNKSDYANAQKYFEKVVSLYPFDYDSVIMLGWTMLKLNKFSDAKTLFKEALLIRPGDKSASDGIASTK